LIVEDHPDLESLAAFAEGKLEEGERRRITVHLDGCEACYELLVESLHLMDESESEASNDGLC